MFYDKNVLSKDLWKIKEACIQVEEYSTFRPGMYTKTVYFSLPRNVLDNFVKLSTLLPTAVFLRKLPKSESTKE